uniref:Uncharacterized protein n=1 Tax=Anguilla anguilla TaxID=7936 RepID=A0A0E9QU57_ANGAN
MKQQVCNFLRSKIKFNLAISNKQKEKRKIPEENYSNDLKFIIN